MELGSDIASVAELIGEPARAAILVALVDGRALSAGELAFIGNVAPQTASFHLRKLRDASLIAVEKQGKHNYYRLANDAVASTLESLAALAPLRNHVETREKTRHHSSRVHELRFARTCYKHLAGALAVEITRTLVDRGFLLAGEERIYALTSPGQKWWRDLGIQLPRDPSSRACIDWTERRHHLGGVLGTALLSRLTELHWLAAMPAKRSVRLTHLGARELERHLGIAISRENL